MSERHEEVDARLERLKRATDSIRPRADFAARVATQLAREKVRETSSRGWATDLGKPARRFVPVAAIAAAVGLLWAAQSERSSRSARMTASSAELDTQW
jgi:hypothetical protein